VQKNPPTQSFWSFYLVEKHKGDDEHNDCSASYSLVIQSCNNKKTMHFKTAFTGSFAK